METNKVKIIRGRVLGSFSFRVAIGILIFAALLSSAQAAALGAVWTSGLNDYGQLGDGTTTTKLTPVQVNGISDVIDIAGGGAHTIALKSDGTVWAWGRNEYGRLGDGTTTTKLTPVQVKGILDVIAIAGGAAHTIALKSDRTVWTWGLNDAGQLGDGTTTNRLTPVQVSGISDVKAIAGGAYHTIALKSDGTVWAWGWNLFGQLGDDTTTNGLTPVQVSGISDVKAIAGGFYHTIALKKDGTVWTWGRGEHGQLGDGTHGKTSIRLTPVQVSGISDVNATAGGAYHTIALKSDGTVWTWGLNFGDWDKLTPVQMNGISDVKAIAGGAYHTIALKSDGTVWTWGSGEHGQLGDGTNTSRSTPVQVSGISDVIDIAGGAYHTIALIPDVNMKVSNWAPWSKYNGTTMNYSLDYSNFGKMTASNVTLWDTLSQNVTFVSASDDGRYDSKAGRVIWNIGSVDPSSGGKRTITVRIRDEVNEGTVIQNTAFISTTNHETNNDDNTSSAETRVIARPPEIQSNNDTPATVADGPGGQTWDWTQRLVLPSPGITNHRDNITGKICTITNASIKATFIDIPAPDNFLESDLQNNNGSWYHIFKTRPINHTDSSDNPKPLHGKFTIFITKITDCGTEGKEIGGNFYVDPAGHVYDVDTLSRISGATVWLQRFNSSIASWKNALEGQTPPIMIPDMNIQITNASGDYAWIVLPGTYRVHVEAMGYYPNDSIWRIVPPIVTDLHVGLKHLPVFNISGFNINDVNNNGVWDAGEAGIQGWKIALKNASTGTEIANTTTNSDGFYKFENITNGTYNTTEEIRPDYTPTGTTFRISTVAGNDVTNQNFTMAGGAGAVTPINACTAISSPGTYVLTQNIVNSTNSTCISITSDKVVFDGAGYKIDGVDLASTYGVYVYNLTTPLKNVTVKNLKVMDWYFGIYYSALNGNITNNTASNNFNGIYLSASSNNSLSGNKVSKNSNGIYLNSTSNNNLNDNRVSNNFNGIYLSASSNNSLSGNKVSRNSNGIYLNSTSNNNLNDNRVSNNFNGIYLSASSNNSLSGNKVSKNSNGIYLNSTSNNNLNNNEVSNNSNGIYLNSTSNNNLNDNRVSNNDLGIYLSSSRNNNLNGNDASNNSNGIYLNSTSYNNLDDNNVSNNIYGISLYSSSNNKIYHNNIINNANQAMDSISANSWDSGYPSGGNYWSDYTGADLKSGLNQDHPGSDGIGDLHYQIPGSSSVDRYPLMIPFSVSIKGDLNNNRIPGDAGDLVLMKRASISEIKKNKE